MNQKEQTESITRWCPPRSEWDPDPLKPFVVEVLKQAFFTRIVDFVFLRHFKNSLAIMCEAWLKRRGIDPTINTSKSYHTLQDEFFKVLAHINRGFECAVRADWKAGMGTLINLRNQIDNGNEAQWLDHERERRKGDPVSRFELIEEPKQDVADAFWIEMFKRGMKIKAETLAVAHRVDEQQARFFLSIFDIEEHKTFTETTLNLITGTQEAWINTRLSSKLGIKRGLDSLEETFASSVDKLHKAHRIILEGNARVWLIYHFFKLHKRRWKYLWETLTGGHVALERLVGSIVATLAIGRNRKTYEVKEEDAEELFKLLWDKDALLLPDASERILRDLHQAVINSEEYTIFNHVAMIWHALELSDKEGKRFKTFAEAATVLQALDLSVQAVVAHRLDQPGVDLAELKYPVNSQKRYALLTQKLRCFLKLEVEIHRVIEEIFWYVTDTFSDLMQAYKIQKKKKISTRERQQIKEIARKHHLSPEETNFIAYAPDRCYIGKQLLYLHRGAQEPARETQKFRFERKTQQVKKYYLTPPQGIRRQLSKRCGRYGRLLGDVLDKETGTILQQVKMVWNPPKIQISDLKSRDVIKPSTLYEITITSAEPRKPRERWE